jgi:hypothetical protein
MDDRSTDGWSFESAREPARFAAATRSSSPDQEHAMGDGSTLCGISADEVEVYRHLFYEGERACSRCAEAARDEPTVPSGQERLHGRVEQAESGAHQARLLDALRRGVPIDLWINGPSDQMARFYAELDSMAEGAAAARSVLVSNDRVGIAKVSVDETRYVIVLPVSGPPAIAMLADP